MFEPKFDPELRFYKIRLRIYFYFLDLFVFGDEAFVDRLFSSVFCVVVYYLICVV